MSDLAAALDKVGLVDVRTYIQSGNVLFSTSKNNKSELGELVADTIKKSFKIDTAVAVFSESEWRAVTKAAPKWWGDNKDWKHNVLILTTDITPNEVMQ